tara:strand:+ start:220 stop:639 length:420 start_codon:yes stop_codon:yes gene_type:complete
MHFIKIMKTVLVDRATDINGRSDRPEYWWFTLYACIIVGLLIAIDNYVIGYTFYSIFTPFEEGKEESGILSLLFLLGTLVQSICLNARRLHDRGHSGWWQLGMLLPFVNFLVLYWLVREAKDVPKALKYKNPYGRRKRS